MPQPISSSRLFPYLSLVTVRTPLRRSPPPTNPTAADTKYDLQFKLTTGTVLRYAIDHRAAIRSTIDDTTQEAQTKTESVKAWKVTDVLPSGEIEFMNVVEQRPHDQSPARPRTGRIRQRKRQNAAARLRRHGRAIGVPLSVDSHDAARQNHEPQRKASASRNADEDEQLVIRLPDEPVADRRHLGRAVRRDGPTCSRAAPSRSKPAATTSSLPSKAASPRSRSRTRSSRRSTPTSSRSSSNA